ncbi:hypothetical protein AJ80_09426 [Polytolypa hystricis UAMH7299]|uniref:Association with the SNF1 complex (ASC) domain-containing protein n=1 Tax=Polytolypa hystricis (strain UAMH7299) TaxID=1447883 RepID=A0A2B7WR59_POLH7|nr:hypothetical protein AJ80_09426 [Polytolypa hystricis UAMH7299]
MGNAPSKPPPGTTSNAGNNNNHHNQHSNQHLDRRVSHRTSIAALSGSKSSAADPSASKESATGRSVSQKQQPPVQQRLQQQPRNIPESAAAATAPQSAPTRGPERTDTRESRRAAVGYYGSEQQQQQRRDMPSHSHHRPTKSGAGATAPEPTRAVRVPSAQNQNQAPTGGAYYATDASVPGVHPYYGISSHLQRPPRLPLPIGDANTAPGSPIMSTQGDTRDSEISPEKSILGDSVADEEEIVDELESYAVAGVNKAVPTAIEWHGHGEKVYITGTFVNWERKFKLHRSELDDRLFTTTLQLRPGTHHLKYIVDGIMRTSDHLPTAVDFTNHLVNYIEVNADEIQRTERDKLKQQAKITIPPHIYPPQVLPESLQVEPDSDERDRDEREEEPEEEIPLGDFRSIIPQFLSDIEREEEDSPSYQQAANVVSDSPGPPMLPLFLGKSILNGTTPMKDDNSVLNYPNHTVLNHLATSSIKNGVLATSVTTRYKRKVGSLSLPLL